MVRHHDSSYKQRVFEAVSRAQAEKVYENAQFDSAYAANMAAAVTTLKDKFEFTNEQLESFVDGCWDVLDSFNKDFMTYGDIREALLTETGIDIQSTIRKGNGLDGTEES